MSHLIDTWTFLANTPTPLLLAAFLLLFIYLTDKFASRSISRTRKSIKPQIDIDTPLRQVFSVNIELQNEFFSQALKFSEEEVHNLRDKLKAVKIDLQIWKSHYAGQDRLFWKA
jgi:hypothetical protein